MRLRRFRHFPREDAGANELADRPVIL